MNLPPVRSLSGAVCLALLLLYGAIVVYQARQTSEARRFPDTHAYFATASASLASQDFWAGKRAPFVPLIHKIAERDPAGIRIFQWVFFAACWVVLALALSMQGRLAFSRILALMLVLAFSLSHGIIFWNDFLLSESLCLSALALLTGAWLVYLRNPTGIRAVPVFMASAVMCFSRDTSAYVVLGTGILLLIGSGWRLRKDGTRSALSPGVLGVAMLVLFAASLVSHSLGNRFEYSFYNLVGRKILPRQEDRAFFESHGMPVSDALLSRKGKWAQDDARFFFAHPDLEAFREWSASHGRKTYIALLASRPLATVRAPLNDLPRLIDENHLGYADAGHETTWIGELGSKWNTTVPAPARILGGLILALGAAVIGWTRNSSASLVTVGLLGLGVVHLVVAWHGDALEVPRHTLIAVIQFRLAVLIAAWLLLDEVLGLLPVTSKETTETATEQNAG